MIQIDFERLRNLFIILLAGIILLFCATSCKAPKVVTQTVETVKIVERVRDTTIIIPADSSAITALIDCQDGKARLIEILNYRPGNTVQPPKIVIKDNWLTAKCIVDSSLIYVKWSERDTTRSKVTEKTVIVKENYVTSWQWAQVWLGRLLLLLVLIYVAVKLIKRYTGFKM